MAPVRIVSLLLLLLLIFSFLLLETAKRNSIEQFWVLRGFLLDFNIIIIAGCLHETRERIIGLIRRPVLVLILILRLGFFVFDILFLLVLANFLLRAISTSFEALKDAFFAGKATLRLPMNIISSEPKDNGYIYCSTNVENVNSKLSYLRMAFWVVVIVLKWQNDVGHHQADELIEDVKQIELWLFVWSHHELVSERN